MPEGQNMLAEIKIRAERKAGEILKEMDRQQRGGDRKSKSHSVTLKPDLDALGITKMQSSRWQLEAEVPERVLRTGGLKILK